MSSPIKEIYLRNVSRLVAGEVEGDQARAAFELGNMLASDLVDNGIPLGKVKRLVFKFHAPFETEKAAKSTEIDDVLQGLYGDELLKRLTISISRKPQRVIAPRARSRFEP